MDNFFSDTIFCFRIFKVGGKNYFRFEILREPVKEERLRMTIVERFEILRGKVSVCPAQNDTLCFSYLQEGKNGGSKPPPYKYFFSFNTLTL